MPNLVKKYCKVCDKITPHYPGGDPLEMHCTRSHVAILKESTPSTDHIADVGKMVGKTDPSTEQESQEELWNDVDQNYIRWNDQEIKLSDLLKRLQNKPQVECPSCKKHFDGEDEMEFHFWRFHISPGFKASIRRVFRGH